VPTHLGPVNPATVELQPEPIPAAWILNGTPVARSNKLATSKDWTTTVVVWDCTAGRFKWHYGRDEAILVVSGEAFLLNENGGETKFGPGDVGYFPAGSIVTWRVADYIRKVAVVRETVWGPFGFVMKASKKLLRAVGIGNKSASVSGFPVLLWSGLV